MSSKSLTELINRSDGYRRYDPKLKVYDYRDVDESMVAIMIDSRESFKVCAYYNGFIVWRYYLSRPRGIARYNVYYVSKKDRHHLGSFHISKLTEQLIKEHRDKIIAIIDGTTEDKQDTVMRPEDVIPMDTMELEEFDKL